MIWVRIIQHLNQSRVLIDITDFVSSSERNVIRVLQVDDDRSILEISKQILLDIGSFKIDNAYSVDEAFKKLSSTSYDVVISDYEMPFKNGLDFLKELKE